MQKEVDSKIGILIFLVCSIFITFFFMKNLEKKAEELNISMYEGY